MRRALPFLCSCCLVSFLVVGCGGRAVDDSDVRARNLKTGEMETFASASDVPDDYIVCADEACPIPPEVPCEGLGAMTCQMHSGCEVKVLSCQGGGDVPVPGPVPPDAPDQASGEEIDSYPRDDSTELCEVTCVPSGAQSCEAIEDQATCETRPGCGWGELYCAGCACPEGMPCDCATEEMCVSGCMTLQPPTCEDLQSEAACLANPTCQWGELMCPGCACPPDADTCACDCLPSCTTKARPDCEALGSEDQCLANPACEWGQFICPPCAFDDSGEVPACDCGLSCRAKAPICPPPPPMYAIGCADGSALEPVFDDMGCVVDYQCGAPPVCAPVMCEMACEFGFERGPDGCEICKCAEPPACAPVMCEMACEFGFKTDDQGCEICACAEAPVCEPVACDMWCEHGFQKDESGCEICACVQTDCVRTGCSGQICAAEHIASTCEWADYYACYDLATCGLTGAGSCGWISNDAFADCMAMFGK